MDDSQPYSFPPGPLAQSPSSSIKTGKKRIIVCCDGTACTAYKGDKKSPPTNVARIARCIEPVSHDNIPQVVHYVPGIGTGEESDWNPFHLYTLGRGTGIEEKIIEAYSFICHNYNTSEDEIILIGFSRGGFIIRCIADLVYRVGVLTKYGLYYVRDVYELWRRTGESRKRSMEEVFGPPPDRGFNASTAHPSQERDIWPALGKSLEFFSPEDDCEVVLPDLGDYSDDNDDDHHDRQHRDDSNELFSNLSLPETPTTTATSTASTKVDARLNREQLQEAIRNGCEKIISRGVRIEVCAAWDTVGSLGPLFPRLGLFRPKQYKKLGFIRSDLGPGINNAFQALSLHDRRRSFLPIVWSKPAEKIPGAGGAQGCRLEQCWFMGYHGDVGGGREGEGLAQFALAWMLGKLRRFVDMDAANFWSPRPDCSNWQQVKRAHRESVRLVLKDTFSPFFWLGGLDCRKPRRQFWTQTGFKERPRNELDKQGNISGEFMHFTVRLLLQQNAMEPCKSLRHAEVPLETNDGGVVWHLPILTRLVWRHPAQWIRTRRKRSTAKDVYAVPEVPLRGEQSCNYPELARELMLLMQWCDSEIEALHSFTADDESPPLVPIAIIKSKLTKFLDDIISDLDLDMVLRDLNTQDMWELFEHKLWSS